MDAGKTYLTGERGPEMITAGTSSTVTANNDLKNTFNTEALESKLNSAVMRTKHRQQDINKHGKWCKYACSSRKQGLEGS